MNKKIIILITTLLMTFSSVFASINQTDMSGNSNVGVNKDAAFIITTLKYEPYPVNAGDWFDVWIQVQNIGQNDALNSKFEIVPEYPFSTNENSSQSFNTISGTINANKNLKSGEQNPQENIVVLKYRVKVADNAKEGENNLKFKATISGVNVHSYDMPIYIDKTKTDFKIVMRDVNSRRTTFSIANIGEKQASAITIQVKDDSILLDKTNAELILGTLNIGEFSTMSFPIIPNETIKEITFDIGYTDVSGVRTNIEKTVPVKILKEDETADLSKSNLSLTFYERYSKELYGVFGLIAGLLIMTLINKRKK